MDSKLSVWGKIALYGVITLLIIAIFAPILAPYDPTYQDLSSKLAPPSLSHWLGTDYLGRDILSRLLYGARYSLGSSFMILILIVTLGVSIGGLCGLLGGHVDRICMRLCDIFLSLPTIALSLFLVGVLGAGLENVILAITLTHWAWYARIVRSIVFELKNKEFVLLSRTFGLSPLQRFKRHILTPILSQCAVLASMDLGHMMLHIAALSFLGLGVQAPTPEWGIMLSEGKDYMWSEPSLIIYPGLALFISVALCNLLGEALRDYFDTRHISNGFFQAKLHTPNSSISESRSESSLDPALQPAFTSESTKLYTPNTSIQSPSISHSSTLNPFSSFSSTPHALASLDSENSKSCQSLEVRDLSISLPHGQPLLSCVHFTLHTGKTLAIMGKSGSGKSTLALALQGFATSHIHGNIYLNGRAITPQAHTPPSFASIMQSPSSCFNPLLSIQSHFKESMNALGMNYKRSKAEYALQEVELEPWVLDAYSFELSGGMLQRVMIALALLSNAPFLIADEPSSDLDEHLSLQILKLIKKLQKQRGFGILLITHDMKIAKTFADKIMHITNGTLKEEA